MQFDCKRSCRLRFPARQFALKLHNRGAFFEVRQQVAVKRCSGCARCNKAANVRGLQRLRATRSRYTVRPTLCTRV
ncbi:MAG: hypothetical protein Kow00114_06890 [Kiloniellaceae bacterium]